MPANMGEFKRHRMAKKPGGVSTLGKVRALLKVRSEIQNIMKTKSSWKTTLGGILAALGTLLPFLPESWRPYVAAVSAAGAAITGVSATDDVVTSEQAGAR